MSWITDLLVLVAVGWGVSVNVASAQTDSDHAVVDFTLTGGQLTDVEIEALSKIALPVELDLAKGENVIDAVSRQCRTLPNTYLEQLQKEFFKLNPNANIVGFKGVLEAKGIEDQKIYVPACIRAPAAETESKLLINYDRPFSSSPVRRGVSELRDKSELIGLALANEEGEDLGDINDIITTSDGRNEFVVGVGGFLGIGEKNVKIDADKLYFKNDKDNELVAIVSSSKNELESAPAYNDISDMPSTMTFSGDAVEMARTILNTKNNIESNNKIISVNSWDERGSLVTNVRDYKCKSGGDHNFKIGEFAFSEIMNAISTSNFLGRSKLGLSAQAETVVLIIDSGIFARGTAPFGQDVFHGMSDISDKKYLHESHGVNVASVVLGGYNFVFPNFNMLKHVTKIRMQNAIVRDFATSKYYVDNGRLLSFVQNKSLNRFIINLSVTFPSKVAAIKTLEELTDSVVVVAAGNSGERLGQVRQAWPAMSGGQDNSTVVTIAALEKTGEIAGFSNWSEEYVDIGALGCDVPVFTFDHDLESYKRETATGTSFAAPQFSATAAWLKMLRPDFAALELKHHVIASADVVPDLANKIRHGRILNATKAILSIYADVIDVKDDNGQRSLFSGRLIPSRGGNSFAINGNNFDRFELLKLSKYGEDKFLMYRLRSDGKMAEPTFAEVGLQADQVEFENAMTGERTLIDVQTIHDIVFARRPYWR